MSPNSPNGPNSNDETSPLRPERGRPEDGRLTGDFTSDLASELSGRPAYDEPGYDDTLAWSASPEEDSGEKPSGFWAIGRHRTDIGHLVMGLAFLIFVLCWALIQGDVVDGDQIRWLLPVPWVVAGAVGLAVTATVSLRRHRR